MTVTQRISTSNHKVKQIVDTIEHKDSNVKVCVRVRPLNSIELSQQSQSIWTVHNNSIQCTNNSKKNLTYTYDHIFNTDCSNDTLYNSIGQHTTDSILSGYHSCIFAYGQTSSGKTHTITGSNDDPGLLSRLVYDIFNSISNDGIHEYVLRVSYIECYNECINDLLESNSTNLELHERVLKGRKNSKEVYVKGLREIVVTSPESVLELVLQGERRRKTGKTNYNERSSRSHSIFRLCIESNVKSGSASDKTKYSVLNLIDLAGSENIGLVGSNARASETGYINKSLLTLSTVITKLAQNSSDTHLPFRDSKLTRLLQNNLNGDSLVTVIGTISPAHINYEQTLNTLRFTQNAKLVKQNVTMNEISDDSALLKQYKAEIDQLKHELELKNQQINTLQQHTLNDSNEHERLALAEKIAALESLIVTSTTLTTESVQSHRRVGSAFNNTPVMSHKRLPSTSYNGAPVQQTDTKLHHISNEQLQQLCNLSKEDLIVKLLASDTEITQLRSNSEKLQTELQQYKQYCQLQQNQLQALQSKVNDIIKPLGAMLHKPSLNDTESEDIGLLSGKDFTSSMIDVDTLFEQVQINTKPVTG